jgi:hypothetical protein
VEEIAQLPSNTVALKSPAELALELYNLLVPHSADVRQKAMQAATTLLGDAAMPLTHEAGGSRARALTVGAGEFADLGLGPKALKWIQKHRITRPMLEEVFHLTSGDVDIIASTVPGTSKREMTISCYLLSGVRGLLKSDVPSLDEGDAVAVCKRLTAYDRNNHTTNRLAVGNRMSGAKPTFTLTGPGETAAADLLKRMATG